MKCTIVISGLLFNIWLVMTEKKAAFLIFPWMMKQMYDMTTCISPCQNMTLLQVLPHEVFKELGKPERQQIEENTGNEGATMIRWYKFATLVVSAPILTDFEFCCLN